MGYVLYLESSSPVHVTASQHYMSAINIENQHRQFCRGTNNLWVEGEQHTVPSTLRAEKQPRANTVNAQLHLCTCWLRVGLSPAIGMVGIP